MIRHAQAQNGGGQTTPHSSRRWLPGRATRLLALSIVTLGVLALVGSASAQSGPEGIRAADPWIEWFCLTPGQCVPGDFNGDGRDDIAVFFHNNSLPIGTQYTYGKAGDVWVALSNGFGFDAPQLWKENFCVPANRVCKVGDFDGNRADDIIEFERGSSSNGRVWVALSVGYAFGDSTTPWKLGFCLGNEICDVGDYDGDGDDDIAAFTRSLYDPWGRVWIARSNGFSAFGPGEKWVDSFFCIQREMCGSGDFNGDGKDDIIAFRKWDSPNGGNVYVATSNGGGFDKHNDPWRDFFCPGWEVCGVADFDGDGRDDIISYLRSSYASDDDPKLGYVYVATSNGSSFPTSSLWTTDFCLGTLQGSTGQICGSGNYIDGLGVTSSSFSQVSRNGDYNGDGRADAIAFLRSTDITYQPGFVFVKTSTGGAFVTPTPPPPPAWILSLITRLFSQQP